VLKRQTFFNMNSYFECGYVNCNQVKHSCFGSLFLYCDMSTHCWVTQQKLRNCIGTSPVIRVRTQHAEMTSHGTRNRGDGVCYVLLRAAGG
jgi:predicted metal-binding transcription factor (methanogenesis marker protein 9)